MRKPENSSRPEKLAKDARRKPRSLLWSPIARLILASNLAGLIILILGALVLNEVRSSLVNARKESLSELSRLISSYVIDSATVDDPPGLNVGALIEQLTAIPLSSAIRIRVHDAQGEVVADTRLLKDEIDRKDLPEIREPSWFERTGLDVVRAIQRTFESATGRQGIAEVRSLEQEIAMALEDKDGFSERFNEQAERVLSVTVPIRKVARVVGGLTIETSDISQVIAAERAALLPLILVAVLVAIITATLLTLGIARPLRRLAIASDRVATGAAERLNVGSLQKRKDEIGDLSRAMEEMTTSLYDRIQENERFAADVAHELKNPLTSIRSAIETSQAIHDPAIKEKMASVIARDVIRLDRLISDISNLSRLEAEIVREKLVRVDLGRLVEDLVSIYRDTAREKDAQVVLVKQGDGVIEVNGREGPLGQVIRNLIENARSFSPPQGQVTVTVSRVTIARTPTVRLVVEDEGPGIPPDKLEKIFQRFYTDRPAGAKFGNNSGLGLSIVRQITETHRGTVRAENRMADGKVSGARFIVELPAAQLSL
ncbi:MAG: histidine kinase [Alphaproteobacteria bacterium 32-64-14]|nr:MAG: histidine kinase [Alphaproteobacteria bacterium 32-64-14]